LVDTPVGRCPPETLERRFRIIGYYRGYSGEFEKLKFSGNTS
jgi:hypothetical protein